MSSERVVIFGASGLLGASLAPALRGIGYEILTQGRSSQNDVLLNPYSREAVIDFLNHYRPRAVVNLIAETNVDLCETDPQLASKRILVLLESCRMHQIHISADWARSLGISTDQLYNGIGPHIEESVDPINVYGLSKYAGELIAQQSRATILRTNFFGKSRCSGRVSFSDWLFAKLSLSEQITVFDDVKFSALHIDTLCQVIAQCIEQKPLGVFNVGSRDALSKAAFAKIFAQIMNLSFEQVIIGSSDNVAFKARRPKDMTLDVSLLEETIGFHPPLIHDEINYAAKEYCKDE